MARGRKLVLALASVVVASLLSGSVAPGAAGAAEPQPTTLVPGAVVLDTELHIFEVSAALFVGQPAPFAPRLPGRTVVFTAGGQPLCSAVTSSEFGEVSDYGIARCSFNPVSPGGIMALLTGSAKASYAGEAGYAPSTVKVPLIGQAPPKHVTF